MRIRQPAFPVPSREAGRYRAGRPRASASRILPGDRYGARNVRDVVSIEVK